MGFNRRFVSRVGSDEAIGPGIFIIVYVLHCTLVQVELHKTIPKRIKYYLYIVEKKSTQLGICVFDINESNFKRKGQITL